MAPLLHEHTKVQIAALTLSPNGSYIFYGPDGIGRATTAIWLLRQWHGHDSPMADCSICHQITARVYADLIELTAETSIGIDAVHSLHQQLNLSRQDQEGRRLVVIDQAKDLTNEAQNALLKVLEEPPRQTIIVILANHPRQLLETVRSRAKVINFMPLTQPQIMAAIRDKRTLSAEEAAKIANLADGRIGLGLRLADDEALRKSYAEVQALIDQFCSAGLFSRLILAGQVAESKSTDTDVLIQLLGSRLRSKLRREIASGNNQASRALLAMESFMKQRDANVGLKPALSALVMQL